MLTKNIKELRSKTNKTFKRIFFNSYILENFLTKNSQYDPDIVLSGILKFHDV